MEEEQFAVLVDKLNKMLKLLASENVKGLPREQDKIEALDRLDFKPSEIARMLNKSPENVSVVLGIIRKKKGPPAAKTLDQPETTATAQEIMT